ncbi:MAG: PDZ domain-containing protein [Pirellulales bacterium]
MSSTVEGYPLSGISKGSPADEGGLKANDVIVGVNDNKIGNLDDFDSVLRKFKGGDTVEVTVKRGAETVKLKVTLAPPK